jgi:hypothetical protein
VQYLQKILFFAYNLDVVDGNIDSLCSQGGQTINTKELPALSVKYLNYPMNSFVLLNSNIGSPPSINLIKYFYDYMNAIWSDGTPLTRGGIGYNPSTAAAITKFAFDGNPNDTTQWSMRNLVLPQIDARGLGNIYLNSLAPQESITIDIALTRHLDETKQNINEQIDKMYLELPLLQNLYNQKFIQANCPVNQCLDNDCVYPADTNKDGIVNIQDCFNVFVHESKKGVSRNGTLLWNPQEATNWQENTMSNINLKHVDCNGDGKIEFNSEKLVINENYGKMNSNFQFKADEYRKGDNLVFQTFSKTDSLNIAAFSDIVFKAKYNFPDTTIFALSFEMEYDNSIFTPFVLSNMPRTFTKIIPKMKHGELHSAAHAMLNYAITLKFTPEVIKRGKVAKGCTTLKFKNLEAIRKDGSKVEKLGAREIHICFNPSIVKTTTPTESETNIFAYPNPTTSDIIIENQTTERIYYKLFDINGKLLRSGALNVAEPQNIALNEYQQGVYFLKFDDGDKLLKIEKLLKL